MRLLTDKSASTAAKAGSVTTLNSECGLNDYSVFAADCGRAARKSSNESIITIDFVKKVNML